MSEPDPVDQFEQEVFGYRTNSENTMVQYKLWVDRFETWRPGTQPTEDTLRDFDSLLQDPERADYPWENPTGRPAPDSYAYQSRIQAISAIKLYLEVMEGTIIPAEPQHVCYGEPEPFDPTYLSKRDVFATIENADVDCTNPGCKAALRLSYDAILRGEGLTRVRVGDIDTGGGSILVRSVKGSNRSRIGLADETVSLLDEYISECHPNASEKDRVFTNTYGRAWKPKSWNKHVWRKHHPAGSHALCRHSPIVHRLEDGEPFGDVYRRARHEYPKTTAKYARLVGAEAPDWASGGGE